MNTAMEFLYRYTSSPSDHPVPASLLGTTLGRPGHARMYLERFRIVRTTPCGFWINIGYAAERLKWVSNSAKKRFAYPSMDEALTSFRMRKRRQVAILRYRLADAQQALQTALDLAGGEKHVHVTKMWGALE
jgi:hypothetical protein